MAGKIDFVSISYVLGILSIVFAFFSPVAGLVIGIIGMVQSKKHGAEKSRKLNLIGIILSAIFFVISLIALFYSLNSGLTTLFPSV